MALTKSEKTATVEELASALKGVDSAILFDYTGLNVPQVTELRRQVRAAEGQYRVVKNTLARRVLKGTEFEPLSEFFQGATAIAFTGTDPVALAKALTTFAKTAPQLQIKAAVVQGRKIQAAEVQELATLPGKPGLYAKLLFLLNAPMVGLVTVLSAAPQALLNVLAQAEKKQKGES